MMDLRLQQSLFTDAPDFVAGLHNRSPRRRVYAAQVYPDPDHGDWHQWGSSVPDLINTAAKWKELDVQDAYVSANGFNWDKGTGRSISAVGSLNCFYVDFDRYKLDEYRDLSAEKFLNVILSENEWLPVPTMFVDSGNGCWMFWNFTRPLRLPSDYTWLEQWQTQQDFLINKLRKYGADPACSDAARVVRCAGTVNSKTKRKAIAWTTGASIEFKDLKKGFNAEYRRENPRGSRQLIPAETKRRTKTKLRQDHGKVSRLHNQHTLAWNRMRDIHLLADLRGGIFRDNRRMATWSYAVECAHYCRSGDTLRREVEGFINQRIANPGEYLKAINYESTVQRFNNELALIIAGSSAEAARDALGDQKARYRLTNNYLIKTLEITPAEQRKLSTIISKDEKKRRKAIANRAMRREQGAMPRSDYLNRAKEREQEAQRLYVELGSVRAVSKQMGLSVGIVHRYISNRL